MTPKLEKALSKDSATLDNSNSLYKCLLNESKPKYLTIQVVNDMYAGSFVLIGKFEGMDQYTDVYTIDFNGKIIQNEYIKLTNIPLKFVAHRKMLSYYEQAFAHKYFLTGIFTVDEMYGLYPELFI